VASLAGSISFGGGDSIFKVHRETVPSIGSQREGSFIDPLNEKIFKNFLNTKKAADFIEKPTA